jgi:hypothetical protein
MPANPPTASVGATPTFSGSSFNDTVGGAS